MDWPTVTDDEGDGVTGTCIDKAVFDAIKAYIDAYFDTKLITLRPQIHEEEIRKALKPDGVNVGIYYGYSMPIYNEDSEEIFMSLRVPYRWDGISDIKAKLRVCLEDTEVVGKVFKFQVSWQHFPAGSGIVPATSKDVEVQQAVLTGRNAQHDSYNLDYTIAYDIDGVGKEIAAGSVLAFRIRRIAATGTAVANEIIILDAVVEFRRDKLGIDWS